MSAVAMETALPMSAGEVTAHWVTSALQERYPGTEVVRLEHGDLIGGTASKIRLLLEYNQAGRDYGLPPSMYAKGGFLWHKVAFANSYRAEAVFFRDWAPRLSINIPKGFYGGLNERQGIALMEDLGLRNARFGVGDPNPLDVATMGRIVDLLAHLHAAFWEDRGLSGLRTLGARVGTNFIGYMLEPAHYAQCIGEPRGSTIPKAFHDPARVLAGLKANWAIVDTGPQTFVHGDAHMGNMFFEPDGTPGYLDFQAYVRCCALHDVNYAVTGSLSIDDRRRHERELLGQYLSRLAELGVRNVWDWDEAWSRYRRHTMHGLMWFTTPAEMQPADVTQAHGLRFGAAAEDYGLAELLGV